MNNPEQEATPIIGSKKSPAPDFIQENVEAPTNKEEEVTTRGPVSSIAIPTMGVNSVDAFPLRSIFRPGENPTQRCERYENTPGLLIMSGALNKVILNALAPLGIARIQDLSSLVQDPSRRTQLINLINNDPFILPDPDVLEREQRNQDRMDEIEERVTRVEVRKLELKELLSFLQNKKPNPNDDFLGLVKLIEEEFSSLSEEKAQLDDFLAGLERESIIIKNERKSLLNRASDAANRYIGAHLCKEVLGLDVELQREEVVHAGTIGELVAIAADKRYHPLAQFEAVRKISLMMDSFAPIQRAERKASDDMRKFFAGPWKEYLQPENQKIGQLLPGHIFRFSLDENLTCINGKIFNLEEKSAKEKLDQTRENFTHEIRLFTRAITIFKGEENERNIPVEISGRTKSDISKADKADRKNTRDFENMDDHNGIRMVFLSEDDFFDFFDYITTVCSVNNSREKEFNYQGIKGYYKFTITFDDKDFEFQCFTPSGLVNYTRHKDKSWKQYLLNRTFERSNIIDSNLPADLYPEIDKQASLEKQRKIFIEQARRDGIINGKDSFNQLEFNVADSEVGKLENLDLGDISEFIDLLLWDPQINRAKLLDSFGNDEMLVRHASSIRRKIISIFKDLRVNRLRDLAKIVKNPTYAKIIRESINESTLFLDSPDLREIKVLISSRKKALEADKKRLKERKERTQKIDSLLNKIGLAQAFAIDCTSDSASISAEILTSEQSSRSEEDPKKYIFDSNIDPAYEFFGDFSAKNRVFEREENIAYTETQRIEAESRAYQIRREQVFKRASRVWNLFIHNYFGSKVLGVEDHSLQGIETDFLHTPGDLFLGICSEEYTDLLKYEFLRKLVNMSKVVIPLQRERDKNRNSLGKFMDSFWNEYFKEEEEKIGASYSDRAIYYNLNEQDLSCSQYLVVDENDVKSGKVDVSKFEYKRPLHCRKWSTESDKTTRYSEISPHQKPIDQAISDMILRNELNPNKSVGTQNKVKITFDSDEDFTAFYNESFYRRGSGNVSTPRINFKGIKGLHVFCINIDIPDENGIYKSTSVEILALTPEGLVNFECQAGVSESEYQLQKNFRKNILSVLTPARYFGTIPFDNILNSQIQKLREESKSKHRRSF